MIGIRFEIPNEYANFLKDILENIDFQGGLWKIVTNDIIKNNGQDLFSKEIYSNAEFKKIISTNRYYMTFADLQYINGNKFTDIHDFKSFIESDCYLLIIVVDNIFVDIYSKSKEIIELIKDNALKHSFKNISIINDNFDKRNIYYI